jgi:hypothetical protein
MRVAEKASSIKCPRASEVEISTIILCPSSIASYSYKQREPMDQPSLPPFPFGLKENDLKALNSSLCRLARTRLERRGGPICYKRPSML